jgi:hypothetical protein
MPTLQLHIHKPQDHIFRPNDTISGHVSLLVPESIHPRGIQVCFWGHSSVWLRTSHNDSNNTTSYYHYRDNAPLFSVSQNVLPEPCVLEPGKTFDWPFEFRVPEGTGFNRLGAYKDDADSRWTAHPHLLPPTFFWGTYPNKPEYPNHAEVNYGVTVQLVCPAIGVGKHAEDPLSATAPVLFQPSNPHAHLLAPGAPLSVVRYPKTFKLQSSALTGQDAHSLTFRQRMHDRFSSSTPHLSFELGVEIPDLLVSGAGFKFRTTFLVVEKSDDVSHIPSPLVHVKKLELVDFTFVRAPRDFDARNIMSGGRRRESEKTPNYGFSGQENTRLSERKTVLNALPEHAVLELEEQDVSVGKGEEKGVEKNLGDEKKGERVAEQAQQAECWFTARVPGFTPPAFTSWAVTRTYRVKVKVEVEIGGKKFLYEVESHVRHMGT